jgi:signal transduction histidine kinase
LIELVKNAFDADATRCNVRIDQSVNSTLTIRVDDDGAGMSAEDIRDKWLVLGTSTKSRRSRTKRFNRVQVGDKGLGRLAALRLGNEASVTSKKAGSPGAQVKIDWSTYHEVGSVDEIDLDISASKRTTIGTAITLTAVSSMSDAQIQRIARSLVLVSDPFSSEGKFQVTFGGNRLSPGLRRDFRRRFFRFARYRVQASFNGENELRIALFRGRSLLKRETEKQTYRTAPFTFELWEFPQDRQSYSAEAVPFGDIRDWIRTFGGVHLFDGPVRIAPAGDKPVDWLDMNLMRVRSPELRPSTNNSIGRVVIDNSQGLIEQTTDRVSFVDNKAYSDLRAACQHVLNWAARFRVEDREVERQKERHRRPQTREAQTSALRQLRTVLTHEQLAELKPVVSRAFAEADREVKMLRADIVLYRAMATAGITATVFAHELGQSLGILRRRLPAIVQATIKAGLDLAAPLDLVQKAARRLTAYIDLPGRFAASARRKAPTLDVNRVVTDSIELFRAIVAEDDIRLELDASTAEIQIRSARAMLEAVLANLITNSVQAFRRGIGNATNKQIRIKTRVAGRTAIIEFEDNAGGISDIDVGDIWVPGATTTPGGTGFGLTIVRDTITDMDGQIDVAARSRFGGARFTVSLPRL